MRIKAKKRRPPRTNKDNPERAFKAKKSLGQNFLVSRKIAAEIVRAAGIESDDIVLEVGPGRGILTEELSARVIRGRIVAVEKDEKLVEFLKEKFAAAKNVEIVRGDILDFNPANIGLSDKKYKIVANIPYYITSHFLRNFLQSDFQPSLMVLMVQKEVAERIVCLARRGGKNIVSGREKEKFAFLQDGHNGKSLRKANFSFSKQCKKSILSVSVKVYGEPKIIRIVSASHFLPKPKVDSAVILIDNISKKFFKEIDEEKFFQLLKKGFSSKRKMLKNNLNLSNTEYLTECGITEKARAENLLPDDWKCLLQKLNGQVFEY